MSIKYYQLAKDEELPDEFCAIRDVGGEPSEYTFYVPESDVAKLRELCATVIDDWMSKVCPTFPFCECGGEYQDCTDETCGNQIYRQMARELGIEVDDVLRTE